MNWEQLMSARTSGGDHIDTAETRTRFDQDFDRVVFSHPFRRLQDKTQVFTMPEDDFVHTRLTHSLEVSSVARSLGKKVGKVLLERYPGLATNLSYHDFGAITSAASLAHDIGNPPFGHAGEDGISSFFLHDPAGQRFEDQLSPKEWRDLTNFEGNAQGFRILNHKMYGGLKLTNASLAAFTKYPRSSSAPKVSERRSQRKYGFTQSEFLQFQQVADELGLIQLGEQSWVRHPLAFLVEAADDICYSIIDLEDGTRLGLVPFDQTKELLAAIIGERFSPQKLEKIPDLNEKLGTLRAMAIGSLLDQASIFFLDEEKNILDGKFDQALADQITHAQVLESIIRLSVEKIYRSEEVLQREVAGYEVLNKLLEVFTDAAITKVSTNDRLTPRQKTLFHLIPSAYRILLDEKDISIYHALQIVIDFVSGLTDTHAFKLFRTITGNPKV